MWLTLVFIRLFWPLIWSSPPQHFVFYIWCYFFSLLLHGNLLRYFQIAGITLGYYSLSIKKEMAYRDNDTLLINTHQICFGSWPLTIRPTSLDIRKYKVVMRLFSYENPRYFYSFYKI
ncbi:hypothetical protein BT93_J1263 [Corymbia citriodora subsp. variegata]|nr:hypothetical protein BT93_J1263 [Corymbia citriodora subsp. variegata]